MRHYLFSFRGRIGRAKYWLYAAIAIPALAALYVAFFAYAMSFPGAYENGGPTPLPSDPFGIAGTILWALVLVALLVGGVAVTVKRLHDRDKAWWWLLVFAIAPDLLYGFGQYRVETGDVSDGPFVFLFAALALAVWAFVELGCLRGTVGDNRFGPDPLA